MTEPKRMTTFIALGGIATVLWFKRESFSSWTKLQDAIRRHLYEVESLCYHCLCMSDLPEGKRLYNGVYSQI